MSNGSIFSNPSVVYGFSWVVVLFLYSLQYSYQLKFELGNHIPLVACIIAPFYLAYSFISAALGLNRIASRHAEGNKKICQHNDHNIWMTIKALLLTWVFLTIIEVVYSGGLPILWFFSGSSKTHFDFGVPTLHGFVNSLLMSAGLLAYYLYLVSSQKRIYLTIVVCCLLWGVIAMTRNFIIVTLMQIIFLRLQFHKLNTASLIKYSIGIIMLVIGFGVLGDLRSGGDNLIRNLAQPTEDVPEWLPTGSLWGYIYLTTPLNNLINTTVSSPFSGDSNISSTTSQLFPSVIRDALFDENTLAKGDLVDQNLNVSTAYVDPYKDMGLLGVAFYSLLIGLVAGVGWNFRRKAFYVLALSFFNQCIFFSIFYNHFLMLPLLMQLVWFAIATRGVRWR